MTSSAEDEVSRILMLDLEEGEVLKHRKKRALTYTFIRKENCDEIFGRELVVFSVAGPSGIRNERRFDWMDLWCSFDRGYD